MSVKDGAGGGGRLQTSANMSGKNVIFFWTATLSLVPFFNVRDPTSYKLFFSLHAHVLPTLFNQGGGEGAGSNPCTDRWTQGRTDGTRFYIE